MGKEWRSGEARSVGAKPRHLIVPREEEKKVGSGLEEKREGWGLQMSRHMSSKDGTAGR